MLSCGIVGLANVGKSTLFNALMRRQASSADASAGQVGSRGARVGNFPFTTIEPNVGIVPVPDARLDTLADIVARTGDGDSGRTSSVNGQNDGGIRPPIVPATVQFVDIAGLVKGAAEGAGLGNKFLSHIREVDLIAQVVRAFPDTDVIREGSEDPKSDISTINTELILADLQTVESQNAKLKSQNLNSNFKSAITKLRENLNMGKLANEAGLSEEEFEEVKALQLLTFKKMIYVLNVNTATDWKQASEVKQGLEIAFARSGLANVGGRICVVDAKLEAELAALSPDEQEEYLESLGIKDSGINQLIKVAYDTLDLISYLTCGVKEVRAWTISRGTRAPKAAAVIHTDFEKAFIKAEVVDFSDFVRYNGWTGSREAGRVRFEGRDYVVADGDVVEFKLNK